MGRPLRFLILDDNPDDAALIVRELEKGGYGPQHERVDTRAGFAAALKRGPWDIVLADYNLGSFTGLDALALVQAAGLDIPLILISGTIGEERAAESIKLGVEDYLLKDNLRRLGPMVGRAIQAAQARRAGKAFEAALAKSHARAQLLLDNAVDVVGVMDPAGALTLVSASAQTLLGISAEDLTGSSLPALLHPEDVPTWRRLHESVSVQPGFRMSAELRMRHKDGSWRWFECSATNLLDVPGLTGILVNLHDIGARRAAEAEREGMVESLRREKASLAEQIETRTRELTELNAKLRESERRFHAMVDNLPGVVFQLRMRQDGSLYYSFMSERVKGSLGASGAEVASNASVVESRMLPEEEAERREILRRSLETMQPYTREHRMRMGNGTVRWQRTSGTPFRDPNGEAVWDGITVDIMDIKRREEELRAANAMLTVVTQNIPGIIFRREVKVGAAAAYTYFSGKLLETFGVSEQAALQDPAKVLELVHPEDRALMLQSLNPALEDLQPRTHLVRAVTADQGVRWVEIQSRAEQWPDGRVFRNGIMVDVTQLKAAETALAESEQRFRTVVNNVPGVVFRQRLSPDGRLAFTFLSDGLQATTGLTPAEVLLDPSRLERVLHPEDSPLRKADFEASVETGSVRDVESRYRHHDGTIHWLHMRAIPHRESNGDIVWDGLCQDITDRHMLEDSFRQTERLQAMTQITDGIAHHFNNLLAIISGYVEILSLDQRDDASQTGPLKKIAQAVDRGVSLVKDLRELTKHETSSPGAVFIHTLLEGLHNLAKPLVGDRAELDFNVAPDLCAVAADGSRLQTAILNLLMNARDALPGGGRIVVAACHLPLDIEAARSLGVEPGPYVQISVKDNGSGMNQEVRERAVNPFFTTKPAGEAMGLGLTMVHRFAKQSGGTIHLHSVPGTGTEVRLILPASPEVVLAN